MLFVVCNRCLVFVAAVHLLVWSLLSVVINEALLIVLVSRVSLVVAPCMLFVADGCCSS